VCAQTLVRRAIRVLCAFGMRHAFFKPLTSRKQPTMTLARARKTTD
jgi:hypothetical protein